MRTAVHRGLVGLAVAGLLAAVTTGPAAHASPFSPTPQLHPFTGSYSYNGEGSCTVVSDDESDNTNVPLTVNGGPVSVSSHVAVDIVHPFFTDDTVAISSSSSSTGSLTSVGGSVATIDFSTTGTAAIDTALASSGCYTDVDSGAELDYPFTVATAGYLDVSVSTTTAGVGVFEVERFGDDNIQPAIWETVGSNQQSAGTQSVYLGPGDYVGVASGDSTVDGYSDRIVATATSIHAEFHLPGEQLTTPAGRALRYAGSAIARSCSDNTLTETVTGALQARKIHVVRVYVDDQLAASVKKPTPGQVFAVPVRSSGHRTVVRTLVKLRAKRHHHGKSIKHGKFSQSLVTYEQC